MANKLSEEDIKELRNAFEQYDLNKDGSITYTEFQECMKQIGIEVSDEDAKKYIKEMDLDQNGSIEWKEFLEAKIKEIEKQQNPFY